MACESSPLGEVESQCCGHVQVLACDYCHQECIIERERRVSH